MGESPCPMPIPGRPHFSIVHWALMKPLDMDVEELLLTPAGLLQQLTACKYHLKIDETQIMKDNFVNLMGGCLIQTQLIQCFHACFWLNRGSDKNEEIRVELGSTNLEKDDPAKQFLEVEKAFVHENYTETDEALYNDIG